MSRRSPSTAASFSTLIPGMHRPYDFIAPTTVTKERAEEMLFTAGYLWTAYQFGIKKARQADQGLEDLKGKAVSVNKGTPYETWAKEKGEQVRLQVQVYDTQPDATQAVLSGRAYANARRQHHDRLSRRKQNRSSSTELTDQDARLTGRRRSARRQRELRNELQDALDCMKKDGTIAKLSREVVRQEAGAGRARAS